MTGFVNSPIQAEMLDFLERVGPSPYPALENKYGNKTKKHLYRLRKLGYVYNLILNDNEFWIPQDYGKFQPKQQETLAWFVVRWEQGGGEYNNKVAISPDSTEIIVQVEKDRIVLDTSKTKIYVMLTDLKKNSIKECLKESATKNNNKNRINKQAEFERMKQIKIEIKTETNPEKITQLEREFHEIKTKRQ